MDMPEVIIKDKIQLSNNTFTLFFDYNPSYKLGQFVMVKVGDVQKAYSISSSPLDDSLSITVKSIGEFSNALCSLPIKSKVFVGKPMGDMVLDEQEEHSNVFISIGSGMGPFLGMLSYAQEKPLKNDQYLFYSARVPSETLGYMKAVGTLPKRFHCSWHVTRKQLEPNIVWDGLEGRFTLDEIKRTVHDFVNAHFYIVGNADMVLSFEKQLQDADVPKEQIHRERWN